MKDVKGKLPLKLVLARMCSLDGIPFSTIADSSDFRNLFSGCNYELPKSGNTIKNIVLQFADEMREKLRQKLQAEKESGKRFSLSLDEWTSLRNERYLNINIHTEEKVWNLGLTKITGTFSAESCVAALGKEVGALGLDLDSDVVCITTDGCPLMLKVGKLIGCLHQLCFNHGLQLSVIDVLYRDRGNEIEDAADVTDVSEEELEDEDDAEPLIEEVPIRKLQFCNSDITAVVHKVRSFVKKIKRSPKCSEVFLEHQKKDQNSKNIPLSLILDCKTRWNSLADMLDRILKTKASIQKTQIDLMPSLSQSERLNDHDFHIIQEVLRALKPVKAAVEALSSRQATLITAEAAIQFLLVELNDGGDLSRKLRTSIQDRVLHGRRSLASTVLQHLHRPADRVTTLKKSVVKSFCAEQLDRLQLTPSAPDTCAAEVAEINSGHEDSDQDVYSKLQMAIDQAEAHTRSCGEKQIATASIVSSELSTSQCTGHLGDLTRTLYTCLLTIPPTSVEAERVFSAAGFLCNRFRTRLSNRSLSALSFLRTNFRSGHLQQL